MSKLVKSMLCIGVATVAGAAVFLWCRRRFQQSSEGKEQFVENQQLFQEEPFVEEQPFVEKEQIPAEDVFDEEQSIAENHLDEEEVTLPAEVYSVEKESNFLQEQVQKAEKQFVEDQPPMGVLPEESPEVDEKANTSDAAEAIKFQEISRFNRFELLEDDSDSQLTPPVETCAPKKKKRCKDKRKDAVIIEASPPLIAPAAESSAPTVNHAAGVPVECGGGERMNGDESDDEDHYCFLVSCCYNRIQACPRFSKSNDVIPTSPPPLPPASPSSSSQQESHSPDEQLAPKKKKKRAKKNKKDITTESAASDAPIDAVVSPPVEESPAEAVEEKLADEVTSPIQQQAQSKFTKKKTQHKGFKKNRTRYL